MQKTMKRKTHKISRKRTKRSTTLRLIKGGKRRVEEIVVELRKNHTNPNVTSTVQVIKGPREFASDLGGYISAFVDPVEEELVSIKHGKHKSPYRKKRFRFIYQDENTPTKMYNYIKPVITCKKRTLCEKAA